MCRWSTTGVIGTIGARAYAVVAQQAEQLICNQSVGSSILLGGSILIFIKQEMYKVKKSYTISSITKYKSNDIVFVRPIKDAFFEMEKSTKANNIKIIKCNLTGKYSFDIIVKGKKANIIGFVLEFIKLTESYYSIIEQS